jgi:two-component system CheB/CheR fusion protein
MRVDRQGRVVPILLTLSMLTDEGGNPIGIASISKDIQKQKDAEREAREAVLRRDEFLAMLSHELRNPLGAVLNAAELLARGGETDSTSLAAGVILRQSRQMARLLDDLLDVSRITQGRIEIRKEVVDLTRSVHHAVEAVQPLMDRSRHTLEVRVSDEPLYVEGDASRLLQIQENLLANAAKYTPAGGRILLEIRREGNEAVIAVSDNGQGIPPEMLPAIFDLFVQGPKALARSEGGMGIGLSLVRALVELHGGTVSVHSDGRDRGSIFTVRLPLTDHVPVCAVTDNESKEHPARILVVEDNADSRKTLKKLLELDGYEVCVASDGISGYDAICRDKPDVVLLDVGLPGLDGYAVARKVRAELQDQTVRLIAVTGYGRESDRAAVKDAGFDEHLVKPISLEALNRILGE